MGLAEFAKVRCGGPAIAVSLAVALVASLTLAPALLRLLGTAVFWPGSHARSERRVWRPRSAGRASGIASAAASSPGPLLIWATAVLVLLPLGHPRLRRARQLPGHRRTGADQRERQGLAAIQRHFTAGEVGPVTVLLESTTDWESPRGQAMIAHLSHGFALLDNVAEVRSLTQPLGSRHDHAVAAGRAQPQGHALQDDVAQRRARGWPSRSTAPPPSSTWLDCPAHPRRQPLSPSECARRTRSLRSSRASTWCCAPTRSTRRASRRWS